MNSGVFLFTFTIFIRAVVRINGVNIDEIARGFGGFTNKIEKSGDVDAIENEARRIMGLVRGEISEVMMERSGGPPPDLPGGFSDFQQRCGPVIGDPITLNGDLCVILQKTCHITEEEFEFARQVLEQAIEIFGTDMSIALITYKDDIDVVIPFQEISGSVLETVQELKYREPGKANTFKCTDCQALTYKALEKCRQILEEEGRDDRYFPNLVVSFTDGVTFRNKFNWAGERSKTVAGAKILKDLRTVGVVVKFNNTEGSYTGDEEWEAMSIPSTVPGVKHIDPIDISNPSASFEIIDSVSNPGGAGLQQDEPLNDDFESFPGRLPQAQFLGQHIFQAFPGCPDPCTQFADIALIIDRSDSIPIPDIERVLRFFTFFINESRVDVEGGLQFAIYTYNSMVYQHAYLGTDTNKTSLLTAMDRIPRLNAKYTETGLAIIKAMSHLRLFNRRGAKKTILLATDGRTWKKNDRSTNSRSTIAAADLAKRDNIDLFLLGMPNLKGANTGMTEWTKVASDPIGCTIVNMQVPGFNYTHLYLAGIALTNELCKKDDSASKCVFKHEEEYPDEEEQMEP